MIYNEIIYKRSMRNEHSTEEVRVVSAKPTNSNAPSYASGPPPRLYHLFWNVFVEVALKMCLFSWRYIAPASHFTWSVTETWDQHNSRRRHSWGREQIPDQTTKKVPEPRASWLTSETLSFLNSKMSTLRFPSTRATPPSSNTASATFFPRSSPPRTLLMPWYRYRFFFRFVFRILDS